MEAIRNYLETMFLNLPNTPEVYKAKNELWQMMEDKYTELKNEGKSENEAVGTVIAEFGNLDELAEDLGIKQFVHQPRQEQTPNAVSLSMEDVRQFLREHSRHSYFVALSVFLFILSACCPIFFGAAADTSLRSSDVLDASGIILMFVFIAIGVGMLVYSNVCMGHWKHLEEGNFVTDFATTDYIHHEMEHYKGTHALLLYRERYYIERTNVWIDSYRTILNRFDTTLRNWESWNYIAFSVMLLRKCVRKRKV